MDKLQKLIIFKNEGGATRIHMMLDAETLRLNQKQFEKLSGKAKGTISEHIKHIFEDGEWRSEATVRLFDLFGSMLGARWVAKLSITTSTWSWSWALG